MRLGARRHDRRREPRRESEEEIIECQRGDVELEPVADCRKIGTEIDIHRLYRLRTRNVGPSGLAPQPVANTTDRAVWFISMIGDVLAGDVRDISLKPEAVAIKNQEALAALAGAERPTAKIDPEFERHVESGQRAYAIELSP